MFSCFLRNAIAESGKTQRNIADEAGITLSALANYLKGSRNPQIDIAEKLAESCGYSLEFTKKEVSTNVDIKNLDNEELTKEEIRALKSLLEKNKKEKSRNVG